MKLFYEFKKLCLVFLTGMLIFSLLGCGAVSSGANAPTNPALLSAANLNLIFVVSPDLAYDPLGDINSTTANLNNQGLQRSLLMGTYLKQQLLGTNNVTGIHVLEPMTHLQTINNYPDMAAIGFIQQFALLNQFTMYGTTANSYPIGTAYGSPEDVPAGVVMPTSFTSDCQGLAFNDANRNNIALLTGIIRANNSGFYVFSAPWETTSALLENINTAMGYGLSVPTVYTGSNLVYVISVTSPGNASLLTFDSKLNPAATYPVLAFVPRISYPQQSYFCYTRTRGVNRVVIPPGTNTNETVYLIRHAEAHPSSSFENGNYVGAGQWRALGLPGALSNTFLGQISPTHVYSIDPAQSFAEGNSNFSYVRPSLTVLPYAIANNLPYNLAASFSIGEDPTLQSVAKATSDFFFTNLSGNNFSNQVILLAWEHEHFPPLINYLLQSYGGTVPAPSLSWAQTDYDTIWTVTLDGQGNLTVNNALFEGINSTLLPAAAPAF